MNSKYATASIIKHVKTGKHLKIHRMPLDGFKLAASNDKFYDCVGPSGGHWMVGQKEIESEQYELVQDSFLSKKYSSLGKPK